MTRLMSRLMTFGFVILTLLTTPRVPLVIASEAGIDGEHIFAGVSYSSQHSLSSCDWRMERHDMDFASVHQGRRLDIGLDS